MNSYMGLESVQPQCEPLQYANGNHSEKNMRALNQSSSSFLMMVVLAFCLIISTIGCTSSRTKESTGEYFDNSVITAKVKAAIIKDDDLKATEISVETFKGIVQLSGFVSSQSHINKAVSIARSVEGVKSVKNDMRVK